MNAIGVSRAVVAFVALASMTPAPAAAQDLSRYREFVFGSSLEAVTLITRSPASDIAVLHRRPQLVQELVWTPRYTAGGGFKADSAREIRFRFLDNQLFSINVLYDAYQMEGLTARDVIEGVSSVYGAPLAAAARRPVLIPGSDRPQLAAWVVGDFAFTLSEASFPTPFRLVGIATSVEQRAARAIGEAQRLDRLEAPQREAAERAAAAERQRAEDASTSESNKAGFRP